MYDKHVRELIDRSNRINIYRQLNPWYLSSADNCPVAAEALFHFFGLLRPDQQTSITTALPANGLGFIIGSEVQFRPAPLQAIIQLVHQAH